MPLWSYGLWTFLYILCSDKYLYLIDKIMELRVLFEIPSIFPLTWLRTMGRYLILYFTLDYPEFEGHGNSISEAIYFHFR